MSSPYAISRASERKKDQVQYHEKDELHLKQFPYARQQNLSISAVNRLQQQNDFSAINELSSNMSTISVPSARQTPTSYRSFSIDSTSVFPPNSSVPLPPGSTSQQLQYPIPFVPCSVQRPPGSLPIAQMQTQKPSLRWYASPPASANIMTTSSYRAPPPPRSFVGRYGVPIMQYNTQRERFPRQPVLKRKPPLPSPLGLRQQPHVIQVARQPGMTQCSPSFPFRDSSDSMPIYPHGEHVYSQTPQRQICLPEVVGHSYFSDRNNHLSRSTSLVPQSDHLKSGDFPPFSHTAYERMQVPYASNYGSSKTTSTPRTIRPRWPSLRFRSSSANRSSILSSSSELYEVEPTEEPEDHTVLGAIKKKLTPLSRFLLRGSNPTKSPVTASLSTDSPELNSIPSENSSEASDSLLGSSAVVQTRTSDEALTSERTNDNNVPVVWESNVRAVSVSSTPRQHERNGDLLNKPHRMIHDTSLLPEISFFNSVNVEAGSEKLLQSEREGEEDNEKKGVIMGTIDTLFSSHATNLNRPPEVIPNSFTQRKRRSFPTQAVYLRRRPIDDCHLVTAEMFNQEPLAKTHPLTMGSMQPDLMHHSSQHFEQETPFIQGLVEKKPDNNSQQAVEQQDNANYKTEKLSSSSDIIMTSLSPSEISQLYLNCVTTPLLDARPASNPRTSAIKNTVQHQIDNEKHTSSVQDSSVLRNDYLIHNVNALADMSLPRLLGNKIEELNSAALNESRKSADQQQSLVKAKEIQTEEIVFTPPSTKTNSDEEIKQEAENKVSHYQKVLVAQECQTDANSLSSTECKCLISITSSSSSHCEGNDCKLPLSKLQSDFGIQVEDKINYNEIEEIKAEIVGLLEKQNFWEMERGTLKGQMEVKEGKIEKLEKSVRSLEAAVLANLRRACKAEEDFEELRNMVSKRFERVKFSGLTLLAEIKEKPNKRPSISKNIADINSNTQMVHIDSSGMEETNQREEHCLSRNDSQQESMTTMDISSIHPPLDSLEEPETLIVEEHKSETTCLNDQQLENCSRLPGPSPCHLVNRAVSNEASASSTRPDERFRIPQSIATVNNVGTPSINTGRQHRNRGLSHTQSDQNCDTPSRIISRRLHTPDRSITLSAVHLKRQATTEDKTEPISGRLEKHALFSRHTTDSGSLRNLGSTFLLSTEASRKRVEETQKQRLQINAGNPSVRLSTTISSSFDARYHRQHDGQDRSPMYRKSCVFP